jgi:hypothetical protein
VQLGLLVVLLACALAAPALAQKTDSLVVKNGDLITGEVVKLSRGLLEYKTDSLGRLQVRWADVRQLWSKHYFEVDLASGRTIFGVFRRTAKLDTLIVQLDGVTTVVPVKDVVELTRIKTTFWSRLRGSIGLGLDFTKSSNVAQFNFNASTTYRGEHQIVSVNLLSNITYRSAEDQTVKRQEAVAAWRQFLKKQAFLVITSGAQQNEELGLDLRVFLGTGVGYYLIRSRIIELSGDIGLTGTQERAAGTDSLNENLELPVTASFSIFKLVTPKIELTAKFTAYPNLTTKDRLRTETEIKWRHELLKDLFGDLSYYLNTDSKPPNTQAQLNDYGINFSLGWSFGS